MTEKKSPAMADRSIVLVGACSTVFTPGLLTDLASSRTSDGWAVHLVDIDLVDIDADAAETMARVGWLDDAVRAHAPLLDRFAGPTTEGEAA